MKIKNYYFWLALFYFVLVFSNAIMCIDDFMEQHLLIGVLHFLLSCIFAFVCGICFDKGLAIKKHNETCDWLHEIAEELKQERIEMEKPFEEFNNGNNFTGTN